MGENQESTTSVIEGLALVTDAMQTMFPEGKMICVYELDEIDFKKVQSNFRKIDQGHDRFSIDISGTEHVFINEKSLIPKPVETPPKKKSVREKLFSFFKSSSSPIK
jgi:hypothetical protein